ncbi:serine hydrolase [Altererythrobacter arenosus]|uniref:Serine hydrolase n=1 Tax=Altererythrobacter arenosus TaxID=3032592 RepID=A0ABY8FNE0_9SPHN|nr:serine hydrolase domain-containing protein [Altererythrobacter sp. CAU 1644]WFL76526.1 serine hydrolase [Altererythrobacter sp. CAU 1644]
MSFRTAFLIGLSSLAVLSQPVLAQVEVETSGTPEGAEAEEVVLRSDGLESQLDAIYAEHDFAGVLYIKKDGEVLLQKAFGEADPASGRFNQVDTIFGIGSRPIDFTIASIYLLAQRGQLSLDDTLAKYYPQAPADRAGMTLRHMMTGKSGLPDFPARPGVDWDADLAWIERSEFERRTMEIPLLFAPGAGEEHSHWAFGVLAAIVERVSGKTYEQFLQSEFFDPAGMRQTGSYGQRGDHKIEDFAVGGGVQRGLPNIPPNWGPTSWLVKGSGGMYSSLGDLLKFYAFVTDGGVLEKQYADHFRQPAANVDGSERGFELFSFSSQDRDDVTFGFFNKNGQQAVGKLLRPLIDFLRAD